MVKPIITDKEFLSQRCGEIDIKKEGNLMREIIINLKDTLRSLEGKALGLAAPQIGYHYRIFVINFGGDLKTFVNPIINKLEGGYFVQEGCLSIPDKEFLCVRGGKVEFFYQTPLGKHEGGRLSGLGAQVFQHELDHLDGVLSEDHGIEMTEEIKNQTAEEREEMLRAYMESLDMLVPKLKQEVQEQIDKANSSEDEDKDE